MSLLLVTSSMSCPPISRPATPRRRASPAIAPARPRAPLRPPSMSTPSESLPPISMPLMSISIPSELKSLPPMVKAPDAISLLLVTSSMSRPPILRPAEPTRRASPAIAAARSKLPAAPAARPPRTPPARLSPAPIAPSPRSRAPSTRPAVRPTPAPATPTAALRPSPIMLAPRPRRLKPRPRAA